MYSDIREQKDVIDRLCCFFIAWRDPRVCVLKNEHDNQSQPLQRKRLCRPVYLYPRWFLLKKSAKQCGAEYCTPIVFSRITLLVCCSGREPCRYLPHSAVVRARVSRGGILRHHKYTYIQDSPRRLRACVPVGYSASYVRVAGGLP